MILTIRGTNGCGKSTIVREIIAGYNEVTKIAYPTGYGKKRKAMGLVCSNGTERALFIPGHYDIDNGGIDTMNDMGLDFVYDLIEKHHELGADVLYEGNNWKDSTTRLLKLHKKKMEICVMFISLPLADCIAAVRARGHDIQEKTIRELYNRSRKDQEKLDDAGVPCFIGTREDVLEYIRKKLNH